MFLYLPLRKYKIIFVLAVLVIALPVYSGAEIYKYVDEQGVVHFTDALLDTQGVTNIEIVDDSQNKTDYEALAEHYALQYGLKPSLVKKVIQVESGWNPYAVSKSGAMGLMQLMPDTARILGVTNPFDPEQNIRAGVRYLKYLLDLFGGDLEKALAAYNAGPTVVRKYNGVPPIKETIRYLKKIKVDRFKLNRTFTRIYKIKLPDGTVLFTNSPVEGLEEF